MGTERQAGERGAGGTEGARKEAERCLGSETEGKVEDAGEEKLSWGRLLWVMDGMGGSWSRDGAGRACFCAI